MKKMRKLLPALAMLLVSAVLMSTASFAWFSTNDDVSVSGMSVKATTAENLVISAAKTSGFSTSPINLTDSVDKNLTPVSVNCPSNKGLDSVKFYAVKDDESLATIDYESGAYTDDTKFKEVTASGYYETFKVYVKVDGDAEAGTQFDKIYVEKIEVTRAANTADQAGISSAIRVAVTDGTITYIYAPLGEEDYVTYDSITSIDNAGKATTAQQKLGTYDDECNFGAVTTDAKEFTIYVWYEGQDPNCTSAKAVQVEDLSISVFFKAADNPPTPAE